MKSRNRPIEILGLIATVLTLGWTIWVWADGRGREEVPLIIEDQEGNPRPDVTIVGPGGASRSTDTRGMVSIPRSWIGSMLSIRNRSTWRREANVRIEAEGEDPKTITLPRSSEDLVLAP